MKELIIKFEPFIFKQTVFVKEENNIIKQIQIPQKELASFISLQDNVSKIHLFGNSKFASKIQEECITKYKVTNVQFCINK